MITAALPLTLSESDFKATVLDYAMLRKWRVSHFRPSINRRGYWSTPLEGHPGCPDLILARNGDVLLAELKSQGGRPTREQRVWLEAAGPCGRLWKPSDWPQILEELL
jgi:hypothetical protein